jgi:hypothetical protein
MAGRRWLLDLDVGMKGGLSISFCSNRVVFDLLAVVFSLVYTICLTAASDKASYGFFLFLLCI